MKTSQGFDSLSSQAKSDSLLAAVISHPQHVVSIVRDKPWLTCRTAVKILPRFMPCAFFFQSVSLSHE